MARQTYVEPKIERVPLIPEEAVLSNCKCVAPQVTGPPQGWCSGVEMVSCSTVGS
ncbi:MAG: hypothetical protein ACYCW5_04235 [Thermoleophilia bacterium]